MSEENGLSRNPSARARVSNEWGTLANTDGRSAWARRYKDLCFQHAADLGGVENTSEAERSMIRRVSTLEVELEQLETRFATHGGAEPKELELYHKTAGQLRRLLGAIGMKRRSRDVTPDLADYIEAVHGGGGDATEADA